MEDIEFLKQINDQIVLSADEPIYQSVERFIHTMSQQLELTPKQIKDALDFAYLADRQRAIARPLIASFVKEHPYDPQMSYEAYAEELLKAHPGIHVVMIEMYIKDMEGKQPVSDQEKASDLPAENAHPEEQPKEVKSKEAQRSVQAPVLPTAKVPSSWKRLASLLRVCGKIVFWAAAVIAGLIALSSLVTFFTSSGIYYYGANYMFSVLLGQLFIAVLLLFSSYVFVLILNALACLLDKGDPQIPFHHF